MASLELGQFRSLGHGDLAVPELVDGGVVLLYEQQGVERLGHV